jgi:hypothetical protein
VSTIRPGFGRLLAGVGGALLIASLFMPWSEGPAGTSRSGWEALTALDVLFLTTALFGLAASVTGGRFGFFRPDVSLNGATDMVALVATILLVWLVAFDWPSGVSREIGVWLALGAAAAITTGTGDFRVRSLFPALPQSEPPK